MSYHNFANSLVSLSVIIRTISLERSLPSTQMNRILFVVCVKDFGARKFIETTEQDCLPVYKYAREARLNLAPYDYLNE